MTSTIHAPSRRGERGVAMVLALFMMLAMSVLGASLMYVSKTETLSSHNYRLMTQSRYGAESGVHLAINYLRGSSYTTAISAENLASYNTTVSPVTLVSNGKPVVLSSKSSASNYGSSSVKSAFADTFDNFSSGLNVNDAPVSFGAVATLLSMRTLTDSISGGVTVLQTWEIVGTGSITGARDAAVSVSSIFERQPQPIYSYAAFAQHNGCAALSFGGGANTNSFDSTAALVNGTPVLSNSYGNVGTNGNLTQVGSTTVVNGSLSSPRAGVGTCSVQNVTALTQSGGATVTEGLVQLSQAITYPTPPTQPHLLTSEAFQQNGGCPAGVPYCTVSTNGATITPPSASTVVTLGNVSTNGGAVLHLNAGIYNINSIITNGNSTLVIDSGPVIFNVAGEGQSTPITINGGALVNQTSFNPQNVQFIYGGTGTVKLNGGSKTAALVYAPNAVGTLTGNGDIYGALVMKYITDMGGAAIHYDRHLNTSAMTAGNWVLSAFTWKAY